MTKRIQIAGVEFDPVTYNQALDRIDILMQTKGQYYGVTPNPEMLLNASKQSEFQSILNGAALSVADGIGVLWAAYFLKKTEKKNWLQKKIWKLLSLKMVLLAPKRIRSALPQRVTGSDLLFKIADQSQNRDWKIFLLGAAPGIAKKAANQLMKKYPQAKIMGHHAGNPTDDEWSEIKKEINKIKPNILFVAYGSPTQEEWIVKHLKELPSVRFAMGIGGAFDFAAGKIKRAPKVFQYLGLEWLWRLARQPSRIGRIINATWRFSRMIY